jgi:hypothetical protein
MAALMQLWDGLVAAGVSALNAVTALNNHAVQKCTKITVYIVFGAGTSAGTFVVEASHDKDYAGSWDIIATIPWVAASTVETAIVNGPYKAARVRCSVAVVGGTADIRATINA